MSASDDEPTRGRTERLRRRLRWLSGASCVFTGTVACVILIGWAVDRVALIRIVPFSGAGIMTPLAAVGLALAATALALLKDETAPFRQRLAGRAAAAGTLAIGALVLAERGLGADLGIDLLLFPEAAQRWTDRPPGRPTSEAAWCFLLIGAALLTLELELGRRRRPAQLLAIVVAFLGLVTLTGYGYGQTVHLGSTSWWVPTFDPMATHTAVAFTSLAAGILFARPEHGVMAVFTGADAGGYVARRLLPVAVVVPLVLGWFRLAGERADLFTPEFGTALFVVSVIGVLTGVIGRSTSTLKRLDEARAEADAALRDSEARFRAVFERAGIGITLADPRGVIVACNAAFAEMLGYAQGEIRGLRFTDITHPDHLTADVAAFRALVDGERDRYQIEKRYLRRDGGVVWARLTASLVRHDDGSFRYAVGMIEDVTERRRAEAARQRLTAILEATPDLVGTTDASGRVSYLNRAWRRVFGLGEEEGVGHLTLVDAHPPWAARLVLQEGIPAALRDGSWSGESAILAADGREVPVSQAIIVHRRSDGTVDAVSTIVRDMTDQKRREETERYLSRVSGVLVSSLDEQEILAAVARLVVAGYADACLAYLCRPEARVQRVASEHATPERRAAVERLGDLVAAGGSGRPPLAVCKGEPALVTEITSLWLAAFARDDVEREALTGVVSSSAMFVPLRVGEHVIAMIAFVRFAPGERFCAADMALSAMLADRVVLALENARHYREAHAATRLRDEVLRVVAHDLRSPIATISLTAGMLLEDEKCRELWEDLRVVERSAVRASRLIEDLLDVARMQAGRLSVRTARLEIAPLVDETVALHRPQAVGKKIAFDVEVAEGLSAIEGDRDRLLQVFSNLIGNAIRFTPAGGHIVVRAAPDGAHVRFSVCDTGPGIPPDQWPTLFDPFWQASQGSRQGAGLGLAIAKGLVEAHGPHLGRERAGAGHHVPLHGDPNSLTRARGRGMEGRHALLDLARAPRRRRRRRRAARRGAAARGARRERAGAPAAGRAAGAGDPRAGPARAGQLAGAPHRPPRRRRPHEPDVVPPAREQRVAPRGLRPGDRRERRGLRLDDRRPARAQRARAAPGVEAQGRGRHGRHGRRRRDRGARRRGGGAGGAAGPARAVGAPRRAALRTRARHPAAALPRRLRRRDGGAHARCREAGRLQLAVQDPHALARLPRGGRVISPGAKKMVAANPVCPGGGREP